MTLEKAKREARMIAETTGSSVLVYRSLLICDQTTPEYFTAYTLPSFGEGVERIYPSGRTIN